MDRRGFLASLLAIPAALLAGLRSPRLNWTSLDPPLIGTSPIPYSVKPFIEFHAKEIARIFGVPYELVGDPEHSTFGFGIEQETRAYAEHLLRPEIERITNADSTGE